MLDLYQSGKTTGTDLPETSYYGTGKPKSGKENEVGIHLIEYNVI